jgi:hypothetical protein
LLHLRDRQRRASYCRKFCRRILAPNNRWKVPGGALTEADYRKAVEAGGFTGNTIVGTDLATLRLPAK